MLVSDSICFSLSSEEKKEFLVSGWSLKVEYSGDINISNLTLSFSKNSECSFEQLTSL